MSVYDAIPAGWMPAEQDHPGVTAEAVYIRVFDDRSERLVRLPVVGYDSRDHDELVTDPWVGGLVRAKDASFVDACCLYLGVYSRGRRPSWGALYGARAIIADRG